MAIAPRKATTPSITNVVANETRWNWKMMKMMTRAANVPAWPNAAMRPRTLPLLCSIVRLIPIAIWVWRTVWSPRLVITTQGTTVPKPLETEEGVPDGDHDERAGGDRWREIR